MKNKVNISAFIPRGPRISSPAIDFNLYAHIDSGSNTGNTQYTNPHLRRTPPPLPIPIYIPFPIP